MTSGSAWPYAPVPMWVKAGTVAAVAWPYWAWLYRVCASLHYNDFGKFYYSVLAWRDGRSLYSLNPASFVPGLPEPLTNLNPPHAMLVVWPFAFLETHIAYVAWMCVNGAGLVYAIVGVCRDTGWRPTLWQLFVLLAGAPTATWIVTGQLTGVLAVPLFLAWRAWREGRHARAGVWLGVAISVKPFLVLLVLRMALRRNWAGVSTAAATAAAMFICGAVVFGVNAHGDWLASVRAVSWAGLAMNASWFGILTRAFNVTPYYVPFAIMPALIVPLWLFGVGLVGTMLVRTSNDQSDDCGWGALTLGALLAAPLGWTYYIWWVLSGLPRLLSSPIAGGLLLVPLPLVALTPIVHNSPWLSVTLGSAYGWALVWAYAAEVRARRTAATS